MFSNVNHVEVLLVVELSLCHGSVEPSGDTHWEEWPHNELLDHDLSDTHGDDTCSGAVSGGVDVAVKDVAASGTESPVSLGWCTILMWLSVQEVVLNEEQSQVDGCLVVLWDSTIVFVKVVKVVLV